MRNKVIEIAWVKQSVFEKLLGETQRCQPYETGGCLVGYRADSYNGIVITNSIGPGPGAKHSKSGFEPDHEWHTLEIARLYKESKCIYNYVGDWHSHPQRPDSNLSWKDMRTLRRIAKYPPARAPKPVMVLIAGGSTWTFRIWYLELVRYRFISIYKKQEINKIKFFDYL